MTDDVDGRKRNLTFVYFALFSVSSVGCLRLLFLFLPTFYCFLLLHIQSYIFQTNKWLAQLNVLAVRRITELIMPFTPEQDAFILMAHFRSGTINADGSWTYSLQSCIDQFMTEFPDANFDYDTFLNRRCVIVKRFETRHCICKAKSTGRPTVLTKNVMDDIQQRLAKSPTKSISKLSAETGLSVGTCYKVLKKYRESIKHE
ncbi:uncharacterized protein LOC108910138 isoform X2 [Anoplophora glabripennis]|uniref:uncharacterized protein LOC108910138 isoform X2 n=1 Tax=Anoplophora glabripennis TaxID=217634 RepID=UPI0008757BF8|nr:uncharacterized protein LOC108910138 isoform X2 [Anoplophora glabripennis]